MRSPFPTPSDWKIAAKRFTSSCSSANVQLFSSFTSVEIHTSAFCVPRAARWRSIALWQRLVRPPANHCRNGGLS
jgi:hypothetical protein